MSINQHAAVIVLAEHLIHQCAYAVHVLVADLDEDRAGVREQVAGDGEAVAQVGEVTVLTRMPAVPSHRCRRAHNVLSSRCLPLRRLCERKDRR